MKNQLFSTSQSVELNKLNAQLLQQKLNIIYDSVDKISNVVELRDTYELKEKNMNERLKEVLNQANQLRKEKFHLNIQKDKSDRDLNDLSRVYVKLK